MFKAIRNLVQQRSRDRHQGQPQVIEQDDSEEARSDPDVPPRLAEPELEGSSVLAGSGYKSNGSTPTKGTALSSSRTGPAMLFSMLSALAGISVDAFQPGVTIEFRTAPAQRGLQVTEVISVVRSTAAPPRSPRREV